MVKYLLMLQSSWEINKLLNHLKVDAFLHNLQAQLFGHISQSHQQKLPVTQTLELIATAKC